ncbi:hypothetical protein EZ449_21010 [Pedobacter frigidisoli]|uniref:RiboL-PSP-HEPN domain-containing protein n=1 Tax=Pedobacter frigidisoli TaxID=2530455 RepID=A0A4V6N605_9SPHI|nr:hypothetical protein [Pedobacter frigidisoli]TCD00277.1 hypothetical protein EZ449_21010 [Pedobacter frigidisoli]
MSDQRNRINTIVALLNSNSNLSSGNLNKVKAELHQVVDVHGISPTRRRNLMKVLHSTRALDSTLNAFVEFHNIKNNAKSIGQYLSQLQKHNEQSLQNLSASERSRYQRSIADLRNKHLHTADSYPANEAEVNNIIGEMQTLISRLATL